MFVRAWRKLYPLTFAHPRPDKFTKGESNRGAISKKPIAARRLFPVRGGDRRVGISGGRSRTAGTLPGSVGPRTAQLTPGRRRPVFSERGARIPRRRRTVAA